MLRGLVDARDDERDRCWRQRRARRYRVQFSRRARALDRLAPILDECAFWRDESSASPDVETYSALVPGMATIPGAMLVGISSPYRRGGLLYEKWKAHYGKDDDDVLVIVAPSRVLNPTLAQKLIDDEMARDPAVARAEYLAQWRDDISTFLPREFIDSSVDVGVIVRPPVPGVSYRAFADPSGGVGDAFTCAIAHAEGDEEILDCLIEICRHSTPPSDVTTIAQTLKPYRLAEVTGDSYAAGFVVNAFAQRGHHLSSFRARSQRDLCRRHAAVHLGARAASRQSSSRHSTREPRTQDVTGRA